MKTNFYGLILALVITSPLFAQKSPSKFGDVTMEDLNMTIYDKDSSAAAVYLFDFGKNYVSANAVNLILNFERHFRVKVLKKDALEPGGPADIRIPLYKGVTEEEKVLSLKAITYNLENGAIVETKLSKDGIFKENHSKNTIIQSFTLPNVKVGSIIEVTYTVSSVFLSNFEDWQFQHDIPVRHSEFWALIPDFFFFNKYQQGYIPVTDYEVKGQNSADFQVQAHHWKIKDVPAFKEEPFMTCEDDYVSKINFALSQVSWPGRPVQNYMKSWPVINNGLLEDEDFGGIVTGSNFLKKTAEELTAGMTDPKQKVTAIYDYVKANITYNGVNDFSPDNLRTVLDKKKGTAADINFLLASMLEKINVPVEMVLLSTRDHGFIREQYPNLYQFNYVICSAKIGDKTMLLDATDRYLPMNLIPEKCLNGQGLVISKVNHGWIDLSSKTKTRKVVNAEFAMDAEASLKGTLTFSYDGYQGESVRTKYFKQGEQDFIKDFFNDKSWTVDKTEFLNVKDVNLPMKQIHDLKIDEHATTAGDIIYLNPFVATQMKENIFKSEKREYPVDFGSLSEHTYMAKFTIPEGFTFDEIPKPRVIMLPGNAARYTYNMTVNGNVITAVSLLQINKSLFVQTEYPDLREFYNQIIAKQAEQIVIKKKI
jgi:hypothetical protein